MKKDSAQEETVRRTVRFPPDVDAELEAARKRNGRTFNAEVVARSRADEIKALRREVAELKDMIKEVLDHVRT